MRTPPPAAPPGPASAGGPRRRGWTRRTLRAQLTVRMVAILLVACAVLGVTTELFLRSFLLNRLDQQLVAAGGRYSLSLEHPALPADRPAEGTVPGQSVGTLGVRLLRGAVAQAAVITDDGTNKAVHLTAGDTATLRALSPGATSRTVHLGTLGDYRVRAVQGRDNDTQITGLPLHPIDQVLGELFVVDAVLFTVLVLGGAAVTAAAVRRTLQPLQDVTDAALAVSELPLTDPGTAIPAPVAPAEIRNEADQVSAAFDQMLRHVHRALRARDETEQRLRRFVADASHELRTPLATIRAYAEYGSSPGVPLPEPTADALTRINASAQRMGALVGDLLLLARLDAGRPLASEPVDLSRLVLDAVGDARTAAPGHRWRLDLPEDSVNVIGDGDGLHQVLVNLLSNASAHTSAGTTVTTTIETTPRGVELSVHDDGPGIPADQQACIFDRFTRAETARSRAHGSAGLGLAIAHGIATAHHGSLAVDSNPAEGTTFRLHLPAGGPPSAGH